MGKLERSARTRHIAAGVTPEWRAVLDAGLWKIARMGVVSQKSGRYFSAKGTPLKSAPEVVKRDSPAERKELKREIPVALPARRPPGAAALQTGASRFAKFTWAAATCRWSLHYNKPMPLLHHGTTLALALALLSGASAADIDRGPTPRTPEGKADLSGVWKGSQDPRPAKPSLLPWAAEVMKRRSDSAGINDSPAARCLPNMVLLEGAGIYKFVQTPALLIMMFEDVIGFRQVFLDGRAHPKDWSPSWHGHSVGKWDRDTLVVDTVGFNDRSWLDRLPHTEMLHIVERYRRRDLAHLEVQITVEDRGTFTRAWKRNNTWELAPREEVLHYVCNENNRAGGK